MDLIKEALSMGFADAAIMDTKDLVFVPEYRQFCEDNLCGNYTWFLHVRLHAVL